MTAFRAQGMLYGGHTRISEPPLVLVNGMSSGPGPGPGLALFPYITQHCWNLLHGGYVCSPREAAPLHHRVLTLDYGLREQLKTMAAF